MCLFGTFGRHFSTSKLLSYLDGVEAGTVRTATSWPPNLGGSMINLL